MSALGMFTTLLATGLQEAMRADIQDAIPGEWSAGKHVSEWIRSVAQQWAQGAAEVPPEPIDMMLYCPTCGVQHIDAPDPGEGAHDTPWTNPPHRSHRCGACGCIWRPADVPTNGVAGIATQGKNDTWLPDSEDAGRVTKAVRRLLPFTSEVLQDASIADLHLATVALLKRAEDLGQVLTVELAPKLPLKMGNYSPMVTIRPKHGQ